MGRSSADKKENGADKTGGRSRRSEGPDRSERSGRQRDAAPGSGKGKLIAIIGSAASCIILVVVIYMLTGKSGGVDSDLQGVINGFFAAGSAEKAKQYVTYTDAINETMYRRQSKNGGSVSRFISQKTSADGLIKVKVKLKIPGNSSLSAEIAMKKVDGVWKIEEVN